MKIAFSDGTQVIAMLEEKSVGISGLVWKDAPAGFTVNKRYKLVNDTVVEMHVAEYDAESLVINAKMHFEKKMVTFAAQNIQMGITQAGKTKDVADFLAMVLTYGQSGSLYEVINEIERLKSEGLPASLSPFVTTDRVNDFKAAILEYFL